MTSSDDDTPSGGQAAPAGPDARFLFANERTFLAWTRTALALAVAGLAITQLVDRSDPSVDRRLISVPLVALALIIAVLSFVNWRGNDAALHSGLPYRRCAFRCSWPWCSGAPPPSCR